MSFVGCTEINYFYRAKCTKAIQASETIKNILMRRPVIYLILTPCLTSCF